MAVGDEEASLGHVLRDLPGRVAVDPEGEGRGLADAVGGGEFVFFRAVCGMYEPPGKRFSRFSGF
jgi:hypothetical protein